MGQGVQMCKLRRGWLEHENAFNRALFLIGALLAFHSISSAQVAKYDGQWWSKVSVREQEQFLWGYTDCEWDSLNRPAPYAGKYYLSYAKLRLEITKHYQMGQPHLKEPVGSVITTVLQHPNLNKRTPPEGGEAWTEKHGFFDGLFWKGGTIEEQRGFVAGEIACFNTYAASRAYFPKSSDEYVALIDKWYSTTGHDENAKVPDVLLRFAQKRSP